MNNPNGKREWGEGRYPILDPITQRWMFDGKPIKRGNLWLAGTGRREKHAPQGMGTKSKSSRLRRELWARGVRSCYVCQETFFCVEETTLEHIHPRRFGGRTDLGNLSLSHKVCNERRGAPPFPIDPLLPVSRW